MIRPRICICHRLPLFSDCLRRVLPELETLECSALESQQVTIGLSTTAPGAQFDLLLLDATIHEANTAAALADLVRKHVPGCKLLLMVPEAATGRMAELAQLGSDGCVSEDVSLADLCLAIRTVLEGQPYCSPQLANALYVQVGRRERTGWVDFVDHPRLTVREQEVLQLIAWEQLSNKQIAKRLHVSLYTVKNHVHNIIEKLCVEGRHDAAQLARRRMLVGVSPAGS